MVEESDHEPPHRLWARQSLLEAVVAALPVAVIQVNPQTSDSGVSLFEEIIAVVAGRPFVAVGQLSENQS